MDQINPTTFKTSRDHLEIVVGDEKQKGFFPRVKLKAWQNEANFSVGLLDNSGKHKKHGNKVVYSAKGITADFYPTNISDVSTLNSIDRAGFEFSITLDERPNSNVIPLSITTKGLTFHYQPELTKKQSKTAIRPDNVVGSYAVYHESKMHDSYKTGKAFHIFRPWAEDSTGKRVWCDLNIDTDKHGRAKKDEISITIPPAFLDKAVYPVLIDPTFGYATAGASSASAANTITVLGNIQATSGSVTAIYSYSTPTVTSGTLYFQTAIYTSAGVYNGMSIEAGPYSSTQATTWYGTSALIYVGKNVAYDLAVWSKLPSTGDGLFVNYDTLTNAGKTQSQAYVAYTWPATLSATTNDNRYSIYALYTPAAIARLYYQTTTGTSATTSVSATYPTATTAGNLLVAAVWGSTNATSNIITGWSSGKEQDATGAGTITIFCKIADGTETTITATNAGAGLMRIALYEYSGPMTTITGGVPDTIAETGGATTGSGTTASSGSATTTNPNDLLFAAIGWVGGNTTSPSWDSSFVSGTTDARMATADRIVTSTGTYSSTVTWTTSRASASAIVAFRSLVIRAHSALGVG